MKSKLSSTDKKLIIEAHNQSKNGLKFGVQKSFRLGYSDLPLFENKNQLDLFNPKKDGTKS